MNDPIHCGQSQDRGVEVWAGGVCICTAKTKQEAMTLATVMLMGPQRLGLVLIRSERIRLNIAREALNYILEMEAGLLMEAG